MMTVFRFKKLVSLFRLINYTFINVLQELFGLNIFYYSNYIIDMRQVMIQIEIRTKAQVLTQFFFSPRNN